MNQKYRFKVSKLVRDHFPEIMRSKKIAISERVLNQEEYIEKLNDKLLEEATEVVHAKTQNEREEELADVLEVIHTLCSAYGLTYQKIEEARLEKQKQKGGFTNRMYCDFVEMDKDQEKARYYLAHPNRYPQIKNE